MSGAGLGGGAAAGAAGGGAGAAGGARGPVLLPARLDAGARKKMPGLRQESSAGVASGGDKRSPQRGLCCIRVQAGDACEVCPDGQVPTGAGDACEPYGFIDVACGFTGPGPGVRSPSSLDMGGPLSIRD